MSVTKDERLQIRVGPADKLLLERAAAASHLSVSAFVLQSAATEASAVLAERSRIELDPAAADAFIRAMAEPATVNRRLAEALGRPRKFRWVD